jgi:hypothetical protein
VESSDPIDRSSQEFAELESLEFGLQSAPVAMTNNLFYSAKRTVEKAGFALAS